LPVDGASGQRQRIVSIDCQVEEDVALARAFTPLSPSQMAGLTARTAPVAKQALSFRRWP